MSEAGGRPRLSIEERAARRDQVERRTGDRYSSLLNTLRAGREIDLRKRRSSRIEWHPVAWTLIRVAIVVLCLYVVASTVSRFIREGTVDTWSGPDATVTSGQKLPSCPAVGGYDSTFPRWVRYAGGVYAATDFIRPVGSASHVYPESGYMLGELHLLRITNTPDGVAGRTILLKLTSVQTGELFELTDCQ